MKQYQILFSLFFILYCTGQYKCSVFCAKSNNVKPSTSSKYQVPDVDNDQNEPKSVIRSERELKNVDFKANSDGTTMQERPSRTLFGSRRHLKPHDAHQVANYFLAGGPLNGHSHFVQSSNCDSNNADRTIVGMSSPSDTNSADPITNDENSSTNSSDSIVGAPHRIPTPLFHIPTLYKPHGARLRNLLHPPLAFHHPLPHIPGAGVLHTILHPNLHPHINRLRTIPHTLLRAASLPVHGLLQAQSELRKTLLPTLPLHQPLHLPLHQPFQLPLQTPLHSTLVGSGNPLLQPEKIKDNSIGDLSQLTGLFSPMLGAAPTGLHGKTLSNVIHPNFLGYSQPIGYTVKYVPHTNKALPLSPLVGSAQQPSNCINNDSNTEQDIVGSVNNADKIINESQDAMQDENNTSDGTDDCSNAD